MLSTPLCLYWWRACEVLPEQLVKKLAKVLDRHHLSMVISKASHDLVLPKLDIGMAWSAHLRDLVHWCFYSGGKVYDCCMPSVCSDRFYSPQPSSIVFLTCLDASIVNARAENAVRTKNRVALAPTYPTPLLRKHCCRELRLFLSNYYLLSWRLAIVS